MANSVIPSLFPFFVATELLMHTDLVFQLGVILNNCMKPLFNIRGEGAFVFIMGIISGYPMGAKLATNFRENNICSKEECERLLSFTNNSGPLFIIGTVGILMYGNTAIGVLLFITHILACITVGFIFRFWKSRTRNVSSTYNVSDNVVTFSNLGEVISKSILSAIKSIFLIGGFVVLFNVIISLFNNLMIFNILANIFLPIFNFIHVDTRFIIPILSGFIELTFGINSISLIHTPKLGISVIITAFLLGFAGISIFLQVWSISSKSDLSIRPYFLGKLLQGIFASFYTALIIFNLSYYKFLLF